MGEGLSAFERRLAQLHHVGLDTMVFIYHLEDHPRYAPLTTALFSRVESGALRAVTAVVTLIELLVKPLRDGRPQVAAEYEALLCSFPNLQILPVDSGLARVTADLRAQRGLKVPDALQLAAARSAGAEAWVTNDRGFLGASALPVLLLDEYVQLTGAGEGAAPADASP